MSQHHKLVLDNYDITERQRERMVLIGLPADYMDEFGVMESTELSSFFPNKSIFYCFGDTFK